MPVFAAILWFLQPVPLDMPRAEAFLVTEPSGVRRLEDRFDTLDLWTARAVLGRWEDAEGRALTVARLDVLPPKAAGTVKTRVEYEADRIVLDRRETGLRDEAISKLSPFPLPEEPAKPRQGVRGIKDILYFQGTNTTSLVCSFLPEESDTWYLAVWDLVAGDEIESATEAFEREFLGGWDGFLRCELRSESSRPKRRAGKSAKSGLSERELLRADVRHGVTNYPSWHVTDGDEFVVLDNLAGSAADFVVSLTNDMKRMRARYAETVPSPLDGSNVLAVARIYCNRDEYLDAVGEDMKWSAAYWSAERRELVACLPPDGAKELLKTVRHEAFHQYLSYAGSMITAAPWFNEGYAQYFEDEESSDWGLPGGEPTPEDVARLAAAVPGILGMDYETFYSGTDLERNLKYRLAWSIVRFLEKGAPEVRFAPFKDLKRDYMSALLKTKDMSLATGAAFGSPEKLDLFVAEWRKYWTER